MHSGRAYLEHTQGVSGLKMIDREPWIEVTGIEMGSGSLPDHHQHGSHSAQLETMGKAKKQRCSLNSSAGKDEDSTPLGSLFHTQFPAFASVPNVCCVSSPLFSMLSQLVHEERSMSQLSSSMHYAWCDCSQQSVDSIVIGLVCSHS